MNGFTLLEGLIVLIILGLGTLITLGNISPLQQHYDGDIMVNKLVRDLHFARQQAIMRQTPIRVLPTEGQWSDGYQVVIKETGESLSTHINKTTLKNSRHYIEFAATGFAEGSNSTFIYTNTYEERKIIINRQGRVRVE